ncbi:MAG: (d)CMP kinase, partial [Flavobacteriaceae bacterium]
IDGYASTGKSTLSKRLATHLGFTYVDTGYMFRVISFLVIQNNWLDKKGINLAPLTQALPELQFSWESQSNGEKLMAVNRKVYGEELRSAEVSNLVSQVAAIPAVRTHLLNQQRALSKAASVVMDGRDIGTVVFPNAQHKFFLNATPAIRAQRRFEEMQAKGFLGTYEEVLANVIERDRLDSSRAIAPLKKAQDAIEIDTSSLNVEEVFTLLCHHLGKGG